MLVNRTQSVVVDADVVAVAILELRAAIFVVSLQRGELGADQSNDQQRGASLRLTVDKKSQPAS
jgi:hypothetical protein